MRRRSFLCRGFSTPIVAKLASGSTAESHRVPALLPGLSPAQHEKALQLHHESMVIDVHDHMWRSQDYEDMTTGGVAAQTYKPFTDGMYFDERNRRIFPSDPFDWTRKYLSCVGRVEQLEKSGQSPVLIIRRFEDLARAKREGKVGVILSNEGSLPVGTSAKNLDALYQKGLRDIGLFWPAGEHTRHVLKENGTLTSFAHEVIERANDLGVAIDTAHLSGTPAFWEVLKESKTPVFHSHGAAKFPRTRFLVEGDLQDKEIRAIGDSGAVIGLHFCTYIKNLDGWNWSPTVDDLMDHLKYLVKVGGIGCVGIGADYFPYNRKPLDKPFMSTPEGQVEDRDWGKTFVVGLDNVSAMPLFTQAMVRRGFTDGDIKKVLGENAMRVLKQAWKG